MFQKAHFLTAAIHTFLFFVFKSLTVALCIAQGPQVPNHSKYTRSDLIYTIYIYVCTVRTANQCTDGGDVFFFLCDVVTWQGLHFAVWEALHIHVTESINYYMSKSADGYTVLLAIH